MHFLSYSLRRRAFLDVTPASHSFFTQSCRDGCPPYVSRNYYCTYCAVIPPSTQRYVPVTKLDDREARKRIVVASSSGWPRRAIGIPASVRWNVRSFSRSGIVIGVS